MKKVVRPLLTLVVILGLVILAAQGEHYHVLYKGLGANAYWSMYDEGTGEYTDISIYAVDHFEKYPPRSRAAYQWGEIYISKYKYEDDQYVPISDAYCWVELPRGSLAVDQALMSASLSASGLVGWQYNYSDPPSETEVTIDVNVSWSASGPKSNYNDNYHYRFPSGFGNSHDSGMRRYGSALGDVVLDSISLALGTSSDAQVFSSKSGGVEVWR